MSNDCLIHVYDDKDNCLGCGMSKSAVVEECILRSLGIADEPKPPKIRDLREDYGELFYAPYVPLTIPCGMSRKKYMKKLRGYLLRQKIKIIFNRLWRIFI